MSTASPPASDPGATRPPTAPEGARPPRTPLTPAGIGESIGEDADPEQDIAPNLGGEQQMQDA